MITSSRERIAALTAADDWGTETLHGLLARHAGRRPERLALKDQPDREALTGQPAQALTWAQLHRASASLALQLERLGVLAGDRLVVQLPNIVELPVLYYVASRLGAIISPVPVQYGAHELRQIAAALDPVALITLEQFRGTGLADRARAALSTPGVLCLGTDLVLDPDAGEATPPDAGDANAILSICWTSGTTGTPKGVPRSHNMWLATARHSIAAGACTGEDVLLNPFPLVNMAALGGFLFPSAVLGCAVVLHHPLDPPLYLQQIQDEKVSFTIAPPALLNQLAKSPDLWHRFDFSSLRRVGSGSAPLAPWMIETFDREYGKPVVNFYGSNEGISLFATPESAPRPEVRAAMFPSPAPGAGIATRVVDPDSGEEAAGPGQRGELLICGATVFDGYLGHDNSALFTADGYFHTGDLVEICGERGGFYRIVGRCKDIINRGGMKLSPVELDLLLEEHPDIQEGAACAFPDERLGERVCACVVPRPGSTEFTLQALQDWLQERGLAKFKLPERLELFERLPRNPLGKVQRFQLQESVAAKCEEKQA